MHKGPYLMGEKVKVIVCYAIFKWIRRPIKDPFLNVLFCVLGRKQPSETLFYLYSGICTWGTNTLWHLKITLVSLYIQSRMIVPPGWAPLQSKQSVLSLIVLSDWCFISCITSTMNQPDYSVWVNLKTSLYFLVFRLNSKLYLISDNLQNLYLGSKT